MIMKPLLCILLWLICTLLAMGNIGKFNLIGSDLTILIYGVISFLLGYKKKSINKY